MGSTDRAEHNGAVARQWRRAAIQLAGEIPDEARRLRKLSQIPDLDLEDLQELVLELHIEHKRRVERDLMQPGDGAA